MILVYEAGFRDPQCRKPFVNQSLACRYGNPCPFEGGCGSLDMKERQRLNKNYESLTVNRKKILRCHIRFNLVVNNPYYIF